MMRQIQFVTVLILQNQLKRKRFNFHKTLVIFVIDISIFCVDALDCLQALKICINDQICSLAWEARRSSCGSIRHGNQICSSRNLFTCQSTLIALSKSANSAFAPNCNCKRATNYGIVKRCLVIQRNVFMHPCDAFADGAVASIGHRSLIDHQLSNTDFNAQPLNHRHQSHKTKLARIKNDSSSVFPHMLTGYGIPDDSTNFQHTDDEEVLALSNLHSNRKHHQNFAHESFTASKRSDHAVGLKLSSRTSCSTLYKNCQRHAACRNLWTLYRDKCRVENYVCEMPSKKDCKEAYEGIQWTGLNSCHCEDDHTLHGPECHWIELLTSHNKCIDELKESGLLVLENNTTNGHVPQPSVYAPKDYDEALDRSVAQSRAPPKATHAPIKLITTTMEQYSNANLHSALTTMTHLSTVSMHPPTDTVFLPARSQSTNSGHDSSTQYVTNATHQPLISIQFTKVSFQASEKSLSPVLSTTLASTAQSKGDRPKVVPFTRPKLPTTSAPIIKRTTPAGAITMPKKTFTRYVSNNEVMFGSTHFRIDSTCQKAHAECRWQQTCSWHLSEIEINCASSVKGFCNRPSCAHALRRFSLYVDKDIQEAMTFCTCKRNDVDCLKAQKIMFPTCMYSAENGILKSCSDLTAECRDDPTCRPWHQRYFSHCGWDLKNMRCSKTAEACRYAVINIRGTPLEADCYCPRNDFNCSNLQSAIYFRNPCFEEARLTMIAKFTTKKPTTPTTTTTTTTTPPPTTTTTTTTTTTRSTTSTTTMKSSTSATPSSTTAHLASRRFYIPNKSVLSQKRTKTTTHLITVTQAPVIRTVPNSLSLPAATTTSPPSSTTSVTTASPSTTASTTTLATTPSTTTTTSMTTTSTTVTTTTTPTTTTLSSKSISTYPKNVNSTHGNWSNSLIRCLTFDAASQQRNYAPGQIYRDYVAIDYRCSKYCTCYEDTTTTCTELGCLERSRCSSDDQLITSRIMDLHAFGTSMYLPNRGLCTCIEGLYICQYPEDYTLETSNKFFEDNGLFLGVGYSELEYKWLIDKLPADFLTGDLFNVSKSHWSLSKQLEVELNKISRDAITCKLQFINRYANYAIYQVEIRGASNSSKEVFLRGGPEVACRKQLTSLTNMLNNKQFRDNLVLSVIKQANMQDNLPFTSSAESLGSIFWMFALLNSLAVLLVRTLSY